MICNSKRCSLKGIEQSPAEFKNKEGRDVMTCQHCRSKRAGYVDKRSKGIQREWRRHGAKLSEQVILHIKENLEIGTAPKFNLMCEDRMHREWLRTIIKGVIRC